MYSSYTFFCLFVLWTCSYLCLLFHCGRCQVNQRCSLGSWMDASRHTRRLASAAWVIFTPGGQLLSSRGICLGDATNNVVRVHAVIEFLRDALSHGISHLGST
jgi:hypothetical protein